MNTTPSIDVKEIVRRAIQAEWPRFEQQHPHLAAAIDQQLLIEQASAELWHDPEFQSAMAEATATGLVATTLTDWVTKFVWQWLRRLV